MLAVGQQLIDIARYNHAIVAIAEVSDADGAGWHAMQVIGGQVEFGALGDLPCRTCTVEVIATTEDGEELDIWLTPYGSWVRLYHDVYSPGALVAVRVPLGFFRVDEVVTNELDNSLTIRGSDAGRLLQDYALPTLASGLVRAKTALVTSANAMLTACFTNIPQWWTGAVIPNYTSTLTNAKPLQYEGSRVLAVQNLAAKFGTRVKVPIDGVNVFEFVVPKDINDDGETDALLRVGDAGNVETFLSTVDRVGMFNVALVKYNADNKAIGARLEHQERRLVAEYQEPDADVRSNGPFGRVTQDVSVTIESGVLFPAADTAAQAAAKDALRTGIRRVKVVDIDAAPFYGIESGDIVKVSIDQEGKFDMRGVLVGGTIPLMPGDWHFRVQAFVPQYKWRDPKVFTEVTISDVVDQAEWVTMTATPKGSVDMGFDTLTGWHARGGALTDGGTVANFRANGSASTQIYSDYKFKIPVTPNERRVRVRWEVSAIGRDLGCFAFIDPTGTIPPIANKKWYSVPHDHTRTVSADLMLPGNQSFLIGLDIGTYPNGGTLPNGTVCKIRKVSVDYARRKL